MERKHYLQLFVLFLLFAAIPFFITPTGFEPVPYKAPVQDDEWSPVGPYADKVVFKVITGQDVQVAALIAGDIDHLADNVEASYIEDLQANPNVEVTQTERLGFGFMAINCQRYPYSIPGFRRALALAADKHEVATIMWGGLGFALDTPVPASCGAWHNNATVPSYKEPNAEAARDELEAAGFIDIDNDGYVEAPNGDNFVFRPMYSIEAPQWGAAMTSQQVYWDEVGIPVEPMAIAFNTLLDIVYTIPRNYDAANYAYGLSQPLPTILQNWVTDQIANPEGNALNFANDTFDYWVDIMMTASDYETVLQAAHEAQQIFIENVPMLVWYSNWEVNAHRTDEWTGWVVAPGHGTAGMNRWNPRKVYLVEGHPDRDPVTGTGGTLETIIASPMDSQNPLTSTSVYGTYPLSQIYTSLVGLLDPRDHSILEDGRGGGLAQSWTSTELADGLQFDFTLYENATWHDGTPVTAADVEFTYEYIVNNSIPGYATAIPYLNSVEATGDYSVRIITNGKSYWAFNQIRGWDLLPMHIWEGIVSPVTFTNPEPVGCGPYKWYRRVEGEYVELHFWENYHRGVPGHYAGAETTTSYVGVYIAVGVLVIVVVLLGSVWYLRKK